MLIFAFPSRILRAFRGERFSLALQRKSLETNIYNCWQVGQMKLLVPPVLIFSMGVPHTGQGAFSR